MSKFIKKINWFVVTKVLGILILIYLLIFQHQLIFKGLKIIVVSIFNFIKNNFHNPILLIITALVIILIFKAIEIIFKKFLKNMAFLEMKQKNEKTKGEAKWSSSKDLKKGYLLIDYDNLYKTGFLINRFKQYQLTIFGITFKFKSIWFKAKNSKTIEEDEIKAIKNLKSKEKNV